MVKKIFILAIIIIVLLVVAFLLFWNEPESKNLAPETKVAGLSLSEIMDIVKNSQQDYAVFLETVENFEPLEIANSILLSPAEYGRLKPDWNKKGNDMYGMGDIIETIVLNENTYLIEITNKNDSKKDLMAIIDVKEKKSLVTIANVKIEGGASL